MIRTGTFSDLAALRKLFANANDAPYDLVAVTEEKCFQPGLAGSPVVRVYEWEGHIAAASVSCGPALRILAVARNARRRGIGSVLLADAGQQGIRIVAAEAGNYFTPGVVDTDTGSRAFLGARGFVETQTTQNLETGLDHLPESRGAIRVTHETSGPFLDFIEREFGRIWRFEAARAFSREQPPAFMAVEDGAIAGFAVHDVNNRGLGFFGPTGVARSMRGRGIGCGLLLASLHDLRRMGFRRAVIPWTDATAFYDRCCGAKPVHRFVAFAKSGS